VSEALRTARPSGAAAQSGADSVETSRARAAELNALVARAAAGDQAATEALVLAVLPRARNLVRYLVRGEQDVDDVAQDALVTMLERLHSFRGEGAFEAWVDGVVLRVVLGRMRKIRLWSRRFELRGSEAMPVPAGGEAPERYLARRGAVRALDELPDKQRVVIVMHHVLGFSVQEAAAELDVPVETARSRLRLGMSRLRELLQESTP